MKKAIRTLATSLAFIVLVAMVARMTFAWDQARKIPPGVLAIVPFQQETGNIAYSLAQGKGFGSVFRADTGPTAWLAPVYPLLVAGIFKIFGSFTTRAFFAAVFLNILFSSAACVPVFFAGKRVGGLGVASVAAWLWALFPSAIMMPFEWIWETSLSALLAGTILWATLQLAESDRVLDWCGYGLLWGLALMTNPALGALLPFLLGWLACRGRLTYRAVDESRPRWKRVALAAGAVILCCVPWTIRNYSAFHRFIPLRSNLSFELWLGNNDIFDEHARNGRKLITRTEETRRYAQLGETAYMQEKWQIATSFMASHASLELRLAGRKFNAFWTGVESPLKTFRETDSILIRGILLCSLLTAIAGFFGIVALWRKRSVMTFPLAVFPVIFPALYYVTHADLRYRHPLDAVLCLLTAIAATSAWELVRAREHTGAGATTEGGAGHAGPP
ncbi:MAG TPA: glycosyltransferase family 39 protein [Methylomirabilota bacterium]|nr:glycosyltransferase family 39 protein [Methylomirabilota bacterium]